MDSERLTLHDQVTTAADRAVQAHGASRALVDECARVCAALRDTVEDCRRQRDARAAAYRRA